MTHPDINGHGRILHLIVSHGSDQYDIHFRMERPPLVKDLMQELEKKCLVPIADQQVFYRGERLHESPHKLLNQFGIFNGNYIHLVGERLTGAESELFRHLSSLEKDVRVVDSLLEVICKELENLKHRQQPRNQCEPLLRDLYARTEHCRSNLQTTLSMLMNINIAPPQSDAHRRHDELNALIRDRLDIASNVLVAITSYQGGHNGYRLPTNDDYLFYKH